MPRVTIFVSVLLIVGCHHAPAETTPPEPAPPAQEQETADAPEQAITAPTTDLEWGETSGSCDYRGSSGECTDLENEPGGVEVCPSQGGQWATDPCPAPDWGSCFLGGGQVNRYYRSEAYSSVEAARDSCVIQGGSWRDAAH